MSKSIQSGGQSMWGGRFEQTPSRAVQDYSQSVSFDARLYAQDIRGSVAHARGLERIGVLTGAELRAIERGLQTIRKRIESGEFVWKRELEDVHMNIEAALAELTPAGGRLHTGRSRNDQVGTDMRLWLRDVVDAQVLALQEVQCSLVRWAERDGAVLLPGYTHLQRAQPVLLAHHLLAYVEMFQRDVERLRDARVRVNVCPLGSGAIAGSTLPLDREFVARELGFVDERGRARVTRNSMDGVSDRDYMVEYLAAASLIAVHLSRLSEDLVLWSSAEFNFIRIGDAFTTGSSLMPQKKNPDVAELARGKCGRVVGDLVSLLVTLKGLPMTYNRDLQEDKERLFDAADTVGAGLNVFALMLGDIAVKREVCAAAVADPLLLATDLADDLVRRGVPFRKAHHLVGAAVARAEQKGVRFDELLPEEWREISPELERAAALLKQPLLRRLEARKMVGAPNPASVAREMAEWRKRLALPAAEKSGKGPVKKRDGKKKGAPVKAKVD